MEDDNGFDPASPEEGSEPEDRPRSEPFDRHDLLAHPRRRRVLERLLAHGGRMELSTLAEEIVAAEHGTAIDGRPDDRAKLVRLDLSHSHLPKLVEANVVEPEAGAVELVDETRAARLLEGRTEVNDSRPR